MPGIKRNCISLSTLNVTFALKVILLALLTSKSLFIKLLVQHHDPVRERSNIIIYIRIHSLHVLTFGQCGRDHIENKQLLTEHGSTALVHQLCWSDKLAIGAIPDTARIISSTYDGVISAIYDV